MFIFISFAPFQRDSSMPSLIACVIIPQFWQASFLNFFARYLITPLVLERWLIPVALMLQSLRAKDQ